MGNGYTGKILMVDLGSGDVAVETIPDPVYRNYLSGIGLAAQVLYNRIPEGADPLGPDNILGFVSGLLTGTSSFFTGRWMVAAKSPLTGGWGDANCGGTLSPAIKRCGFDGIFFYRYQRKTGLSSGHQRQGGTDGRQMIIWGRDTVETESCSSGGTPARKSPGWPVSVPLEKTCP
jgi:aldehyde:ferredoxin oxidoreductase